MSDETMDLRLEEVEEQVAELMQALRGDPMADPPKPGVLLNQVRMLNALFDAKEGAVPRLTSIERRELERMSWARGAWFIMGGIGTLLGWLLHYLFK